MATIIYIYIYIYIYLARAKSEALDNIYSLFKQNIKYCIVMLSGEGINAGEQ